uniref:Uncharacterized protein n=1 Tax=Lotus japonicus TaxID=34305 RepID=I3S811_LOTJA|nr:unknown [Lotus japonicus]
MYLSLHPQHCYVYLNFRNPCSCTRTKQNQACRGVVSVLSRGSNCKSGRRETAVAARDRVVDFGKYKGKMLGSLPSSYLKWVSKNLRAGDSEEWAKLADQVLGDPIYRDRIEWELALNVLNGNSSSSRQPTSIRGGAVSELEEISERFGWDNLDKIGWGKLDFDLLGTCKGGRIPRLVNLNLIQPKQQRVRDNHTPEPQPSRRTERRERRKMMKLRTQEEEAQAEQQQLNNNFHKSHTHSHREEEQEQDVKNAPIANPFPGRQALLRRAMNHRTTPTTITRF